MGLLLVIMAQCKRGSGEHVAGCIVRMISKETSATMLPCYIGLVVEALIRFRFVHTAPCQAQ